METLSFFPLCSLENPPLHLPKRVGLWERFLTPCQQGSMSGQCKTVRLRLVIGCWNDRLQNSRIFCERGRPSICERKAVWSECENGEGEWRETLKNTRCNWLCCNTGVQGSRVSQARIALSYGASRLPKTFENDCFAVYWNDKIVDRFIITITLQIITRVTEDIWDPMSACFRNNGKVDKARET